MIDVNNRQHPLKEEGGERRREKGDLELAAVGDEDGDHLGGDHHNKRLGLKWQEPSDPHHLEQGGERVKKRSKN
jgi:hypothetical protein